MKMETKTGRWKYAAIVLIAALLIGLLWNHVKNGPKGEIYLYGETHSTQSILDKELSIWGEYYEKGMRDLFVEFPYTDAQFLNLWMQADDDELLDLQFKDWGGTEGGTEVMKNFLKQIKEQYPETVFHGTDVGHTWESTGPRYLAYLEANGQKDTEEYKRTQEKMEQGKRYYEIKATDEASSGGPDGGELPAQLSGAGSGTPHRYHGYLWKYTYCGVGVSELGLSHGKTVERELWGTSPYQRSDAGTGTDRHAGSQRKDLHSLLFRRAGYFDGKGLQDLKVLAVGRRIRGLQGAADTP